MFVGLLVEINEQNVKVAKWPFLNVYSKTHK